MKEWNELLDAYSYDMEMAVANYEMMGYMLDKRKVVADFARLGERGWYIYGGGYIGIQLYQAIADNITIVSVVDKSGNLLIDIPEIPVISLDKLEIDYSGQAIVITSGKFYHQIYDDLVKFVPKDNIFYLGEIIGGLL